MSYIITGSLIPEIPVINGELATQEIITGLISSSEEYGFVITGTLDIVPSFSNEIYDGVYVVTPKINIDQILETKDKIMENDVTVLKIPLWETSNESGGTTVYIAMEIE